MERILTTDEMKRADAETIASLDLFAGMQNGEYSGERMLIRKVGSALANACAFDGRIAVVCGGGNNGADGFALASALQSKDLDVTVFRVTEKLSGAGKYLFEDCQRRGVRTILTEEPDFDGYDVIVDCLFGTGFSGNVREPYKSVIGKINASGAFVVSVDINSGLDAKNGRGKIAVKSDLTLAVEHLKPGHFLNDAKDFIKEVRPVTVGIRSSEQPTIWRSHLDKADFEGFFAPRAQNSHKGEYGYVTLFGGCTRYTGAVKLANLAAAAMRSGAGVVRLAAPASLTCAIAPYLLESTFLPVPDENGTALYDEKILDEALRNTACLAVGMGWGAGIGDGYEKILSRVLHEPGLKLILDADALNTLAKGNTDLLKSAEADVLLTPHVGELARLTGKTGNEILDDPLKCAEEFAKEYGVTVLLKGPSTIVTNGCQSAIVSSGSAGMATAGSGDVLSGVLCGLFGSRDLTVFNVSAGAYLTGIAGEIAEDRVGATSMIASDTVSSLPIAIGLLTKTDENA